ncbi:MAG: DUF4199 domain-containing protein [Alistipes sp.]
MEKTNFWNEAAKYGAIIGALLVVSAICEMYLQMAGNYTIFILEWLLVVVVHYYLLHRYTKRRSLMYSAEEGYTFGQAYSYLVVVSLFSGVWLGLVSYFYRHFIVGYETYMTKTIAGMSQLVSQGGIPSSMSGMYNNLFTQLQNAPEPSILNTIGGGVMSSVLFGALFGLIIAGVLSREPKLFKSDDNQTK